MGRRKLTEEEKAEREKKRQEEYNQMEEKAKQRRIIKKQQKEDTEKGVVNIAHGLSDIMLENALPNLIQERLDQFDGLMGQYMADTQELDFTRKKLNNLQIVEYIVKPFIDIPFNQCIKYKPWHIRELTRYIEAMLYKANKYEITVLDLTDFCHLLNVSKHTFIKYWKSDPDEEMRESCQMAVDMLVSFLNKAALFNKVDTYMAQFIQKSLHELRDNFEIPQPPQNTVILVGENNDLLQRLRNNRNNPYLNESASDKTDNDSGLL